MPDTKTVIAKGAAIGVPCPKKSVLKKDEAGKPIPGEYALVELKHVEPGEPVTLPAGEADRLIGLGFAKEVKTAADKPSK